MKPSGRVIEGERTYLCYITPEMVTEKYVNWLNDGEINRYLEARFGVPYTMESVKSFVETQWKDPNTHMFAIMLKEGGVHIGNIKVGPINVHHKFADVGIVVGEKSFWGKGYGTEAIKLASKYAFEKLGLHKLIAGCYAPNVSSEKAFLKAGYSREGNVKRKFLCNSEYVDDLIFGKVNENR
jgi:ribosomal-protein-alanine N-acetyltransferase